MPRTGQVVFRARGGRLFVPLVLALSTSACSKSAAPGQGVADSAATDTGGSTGSAGGGSGGGGSGGGGDAGTTDANAPTGLTVASVLAAYTTWQRRTPEPVPLAAQIFTLCRSPSAAEQAFVDSEHGKMRMVLDWLNPAAAVGYADKGRTPFPPGAAIVKEKLLRDGAGALQLVARGVMIKCSAGFDAQHGDWEFAYWEPAAGLSAGAQLTQSCGGCHAGASSTDFVFFDQDWRRP